MSESALERHYANVGRVAVKFAEAEQSAALIVYAARDRGFDMSGNHLKYAADSATLDRDIEQLASDRAVLDGIAAKGGIVATESTRIEGRRLAGIRLLRKRLGRLKIERDELAHSSVQINLFSGLREGEGRTSLPLPEQVHARSGARPLPSGGEVAKLVAQAESVIKMAHSLTARTASAYDSFVPVAPEPGGASPSSPVSRPAT